MEIGNKHFRVLTVREKEILVVSASWIHDVLMIKTPFQQWVSAIIEKYQLIPGKEYFRSWSLVKGHHLATFFSAEIGKGISFTRGTPASFILRQKISQAQEKDLREFQPLPY